MPDLNKAYTWAIETCNANNVGYSQPYRNQQTVNGITYYDCSSFIWYSLIAGGWDCVSANGGSTWPFVTWTMPGVLQTLGFTHYNSADVMWLPGDILLSSGHTEMCYSGEQAQGVCMGAHTNNAPLSGQVSIGSSSGDTGYISTPSRFPDLWRYGDGGATGYGLSIYVVSAIAGNWWQESGINPGIYESLNVVDLKDNNVYGGYGLGQWTNAPQFGTYRRTALANWLDDNGYAYDSPVGQFEFLIEEDVWYSEGPAAMYANLHDFLYSSSTDLYELTGAFLRGWEGIYSADRHQARYEYAQRAYDFILGHAQDSSINSWYNGNFYCTNDQILNNAVMLYRMVSAGGGGGGTEGSVIKGLPLYMYLFL